VSVGSDRWLFIGSYGPADHATIHTCTLDEDDGEIRVMGSASGIVNPSFLTVSPGGGHLYAVSETGLVGDGSPGSVHALQIVTRPDALELVTVNHQPSGGGHPCHLCIDADGLWVAVSNYGTGSVAVLPIRPDGGLGDIASIVQHEGYGPNPDRQRGPHAHAATFTPDGRFLIAADLGADRLLISAFDRRTGSLRPHGEVETHAGAGPRHLAFHPDGAHLFVVNELENSLTLYRWDADAGTLSVLSTLPTLPPRAPESIAADIRVAADGNHIYVSNRGHDSVAVFAFDRHRMNRVAVRSGAGAWPRGLGLAPCGNHLLVANQHSDEVVVLPVSAGGSEIGAPVARVRIPRPTCIAFAGEPRSPR
jgi:6-phosphogluconolactonase